MSEDECEWKQSSGDDDFDRTFSTGCGGEWQFYDGGPAENGMKYCCYCGKKIKEKA